MEETGETPVQSLGQEDPPGGENGNPLPVFLWENPTDRGARWATDRGIAKSRTQLSARATHTRIRSGTHAHIVLFAKGAAKVFPRSVPTSHGFHIMTAPPSGILWKSIPPPSLLALGVRGGVWKGSKHCPLHTASRSP